MYGVSLAYRDVEGVPRQASHEAIVAALGALGAPVAGHEDAGEAVRSRRLEAWTRLVPPVVVLSAGSSGATIPVRTLTAEAPRRLEWTLRIEGGRVLSGRVRVADLSLVRGGRIEGRDREVRRLRMPGPIPMGYHRLELRLGLRRGSCTVMAAPEASWGSERQQREWGVFQPLYGLRHARDWGVGDLPALGEFAAWVGSLGGRVAGTLPLLSTFVDTPFDPGPYRPISRLFWNELYVDPLAAPELERSTEARTRLHQLESEIGEIRELPLVDYRRSAEARHSVLYALAETFFGGRAAMDPAFRGFLSASPELGEFARFRASNGFRSDPDPGLVRMHVYAQWLFARQLRNARDRAAATGLYFDFPVGVHPDGYDVWRRPRLFARRMSIGAPPDPFFADGQVWGCPPMPPDRMREDGYDYLRRSLATSMKSADLLRLDHVMFLQRLYCVPAGMSGGDGVYISYPGEEIAAVIRIESQRAECEVVGEDLGTVTDDLRALLDGSGIRRMYVLGFEPASAESHPSAVASPGSVASLNTHDMPSFSSYLCGDDIRERVQIGQLPAAAEAEARSVREREVDALLDRIGAPGVSEPSPGRASAALAPVLDVLGRSRARFVVVSGGDLLGVRERHNIPGTTVEYPNWRLRSPLAIEALKSDDAVRQLLLTLDAARRAGIGEDG